MLQAHPSRQPLLHCSSLLTSTTAPLQIRTHYFESFLVENLPSLLKSKLQQRKLAPALTPCQLCLRRPELTMVLRRLCLAQKTRSPLPSTCSSRRICHSQNSHRRCVITPHFTTVRATVQPVPAFTTDQLQQPYSPLKPKSLPVLESSQVIPVLIATIFSTNSVSAAFKDRSSPGHSRFQNNTITWTRLMKNSC